MEFDVSDFNLTRSKFGFKVDATMATHFNFTNIY